MTYHGNGADIPVEPADDEFEPLAYNRPLTWGNVFAFTLGAIVFAAPLAAGWRVAVEFAKWGWVLWPA